MRICPECNRNLDMKFINNVCSSCYHRDYRKKNPEKHKEWKRISRKNYGKERKKRDDRKYYLKHKKEMNEKGKIYYEKNKKWLSVNNEEYRKSHLEQFREYDKKYYITHKEKRKEYQEKYSKTHKKQLLEKGRKWKKKNPDKVKRYKRNSLLKIFENNKNITYSTLRGWSILVRERDNNQCQICGSSSRLHAHHILHKKYYPQLALNENNGITLCIPCHVESHTKFK